jgi:PiT family inorganic phosphate transporter
VGGYAGAAIVAYGGVDGLLIREGWNKTLVFIVASPLIGMTLGFLIMVAVLWLFRGSTVTRVDRLFRRGQLLSAAAYSLGHGGNDAQKTMGIITAVLVAGNLIPPGPGGKLPEIPLWVVLSAHAAIAAGTLSGGWRIVHTMGSRITRLTPFQGFCAETGGAITLFAATELGVPVSTTHTITGCIIGVGAARRISAVRWSVANNIVIAWIITIPASALIAALFYALAGLF